jgi:hypothetical protein
VAPGFPFSRPPPPSPYPPPASANSQSPQTESRSKITAILFSFRMSGPGIELVATPLSPPSAAQ